MGDQSRCDYVEKVVSLEPDLVIAGGNNFNKPEAITQLRDLGVKLSPAVPSSAASVMSLSIASAVIGSGRRNIVCL